MSKISDKIPISTDEKCSKCMQDYTRGEYINECVLFYDLDMSKINLLNWEQTYFVYKYNDLANSYCMDKQFNFIRYKGDTSDITYTGNEFSINFDEYLNHNFNISYCNNLGYSEKITIPIFYMYVNKNSTIFDLMVQKILLENNNEDINILTSIFAIDRETQKYIGMSFKLNIFNLSLLCNKFFDIIPLFLSIDISEEFIKKELVRLFDKFSYEKMYVLMNDYKMSISSFCKTDKEIIKGSFYTNEL